jgi:uncharacterized protein (UPF0297 family)
MFKLDRDELMEERSVTSGAPTFLPGKSGEEAWTRREERDIIGRN